MPKTSSDYEKKPVRKSKQASTNTDNSLRQLAFNHSLQANIISTASTGQIVIANAAACKLLGYSKAELLTKTRTDIFDASESAFKKMLKQRTEEGHSIARGTGIKKSGCKFPCDITSAVFIDEDGVKKAIFTITDISQIILTQKNIDIVKDKLVADNILLAKSRQKNIDTKNEKIVSDNIMLAKSAQKKIDIKKEKIVTDNIAQAISDQERIDIEKEKIVTDNIAQAISDQEKIDVRKAKVVARNIRMALAKSDARLEESNQWIKQIAKASYDVMWDWDIASGEIYVGDSITEMFGYNIINNTVSFADFSRCLIPAEKQRIEKKMLQVLASTDETWTDVYLFTRADGSLASTISRASIVRDGHGKAIRLIGATQDVSELHDLERRLEEQISSDTFHLASQLSYEGIWDWNLLTNEFFLGEGFEDLFGYPFDNVNNKTFDWAKHLHPDDRLSVEKSLQEALASSATHWEAAYRFVRVNGSIANVHCRASIIRKPDGSAFRMIGAIHDLTRQKALEEKLAIEIASKAMLISTYKENFRLVLNSSSDVLYDIDLLLNKVVLSQAYEKEFGYPMSENMKPSDIWPRHIHPDDQEAAKKDYVRMLASGDTEWKCSYRFLRADGSVANVLSSRVILRDEKGNPVRMIGSMQDISKQVILEEKLRVEILLKEKQIAAAAAEAKETVRSDIGKELHDNVNQLLSISRLYIDMAKNGGDNSKAHLSRSSEYTLLAIEEIRKLSKVLTTDVIKDLGLKEAIDNIITDTMEVKPIKISAEIIDFQEEQMSVKCKVNTFRIIQEQLSNILKHAKATTVIIRLALEKEYYILSISDDGVGFDTGASSDGIGLANIKSRTSKYHGTAEFISAPGKGCLMTIRLPYNECVDETCP